MYLHIFTNWYISICNIYMYVYDCIPRCMSLQYMCLCTSVAVSTPASTRHPTMLTRQQVNQDTRATGRRPSAPQTRTRFTDRTSRLYSICPASAVLVCPIQCILQSYCTVKCILQLYCTVQCILQFYCTVQYILLQLKCTVQSILQFYCNYSVYCSHIVQYRVHCTVHILVLLSGTKYIVVILYCTVYIIVVLLFCTRYIIVVLLYCTGYIIVVLSLS